MPCSANLKLVHSQSTYRKDKDSLVLEKHLQCDQIQLRINKMPAQPPPLPPRSPSIASSVSSWSSGEGRSYSPNRPGPRVNTVHLTPQTRYTVTGEKQTHPYSAGTGIDDPRSSSTQSLRPIESAGPNRRKLLLVYIHGFMGTETSFKSFPAHVHNILTASLAETHVVHSKIYPRYQSRKNISFARDAFSNWLIPHESDTTDIILIGHSLGGILAAEVVLFPSHRPGSKDLFHHRILGHLAFDTPFLGMHPGVVTTGIASLFRSAPDPPEAPAYDSTANPLGLSFNPFEESSDSNYNPSYGNDVHLPKRKGKLDQAFYFLNKHYGDWQKATTAYVKSHLEFGGCMADYDGLKKRYRSFRPLEDVDDLKNTRSPSGKTIPRVRFVNYYTASTGRIKPQPKDDMVLVAETEMTEQGKSTVVTAQQRSSAATTPRISVEEHRDDHVLVKDMDSLHLDGTAGSDEEAEMQHLDPQAEPPSPTLEPARSNDSEEIVDPVSRKSTADAESVLSSIDTASITSSALASTTLPPLPQPPHGPDPFDPALYTTDDSSTLKLAQKEHSRLVKAYEKAKKDYDKMVRDREKLVAKIEKARQKQEEKENANLSQHEKSERERLKKEAERMQKEKERMEGKPQKEEVQRAVTLNQEMYDDALARQHVEETEQMAKKAKNKEATKPPKPKKDRKFCSLPPADTKTGKPDSTWIRVYMENMDEVVAHTSLFFVSETYAQLVGDTAQRIKEWVEEDGTIRLIKESQEWQRGA